MLHTARAFALRIGTVLMAMWLAVGAAALEYDARPRFDQAALDAMIAPIALYPDQLLSQVLMAASYPEEVEEAARWSRERPGLTGDAAVRSAEGWDWDPSVRSLTAFPHVLATMAQHMAWTEDLGHAFIVQPDEVMDTVQRLRFRAYDAGTLHSTATTRVVHTGSSILIESVQPQVVYVPYYDTQVVYGPWWWPARPPMSWSRWHGYHEPYGPPAFVHWGPGTWISAGFFFGGFDWPRREVRVVNTRTYYYAHRDRVRRFDAHRPPVLSTPHVWRHDQVRRQAWREQRRDAEAAGRFQQRQQRESSAQRQQVEAAGQAQQPRAPQFRRDAPQAPVAGTVRQRQSAPNDDERARLRRGPIDNDSDRPGVRNQRQSTPNDDERARLRRGPIDNDSDRPGVRNRRGDDDGGARLRRGRDGDDGPQARDLTNRRAPVQSPGSAGPRPQAALPAPAPAAPLAPAAARPPAPAPVISPPAEPRAVERSEGGREPRRSRTERGRD